jgi:phosphate starvation-inducible PhoH-like protein
MQNATPEQMKMLLTRIGDNSKLIVTGDLNQHDRGYSDNGLKDFLERIREVKSERISLVEFDHTQIERHPAVAEVLKIYKAY